MSETKLIIFDKDGTIVEPISGGTFVQHPSDQRLRPGVAEKLEQLRGDRVMMAIASNQGGCSVFEVLAEDIRPGMSIDLDGQWAKVLEVEATTRNTHLLTDTGRHTISGLFDARYKSIDDAYDEMKFAMKLMEPYLHYETLNQFRGIFCPDMDGKTAHVIKARSPQGEYRRSIALEYPVKATGYRKPAPGMLIDAEQWLRWSNIDVTERLMVGDRPEDQAAAAAAGFAFEWASDYFGGDND
jgi:histidinol phosphatase-like enzyme